MTRSTSTIVSPWELKAGFAQLATPNFSAKVELGRPDAGCQEIRLRGADVGLDHALAVVRVPSSIPAPPSLPIVVEDSYTRGGDLVVTYAETPAWPIRWQVYWRLLIGDSLGPALAGLELIVSAQTSSLDSLPALEVKTIVRGPCQAATGDSILARLAGTEFTYMQIIHPADDQGNHVEPVGDGIVIRHPLFLRPLEKGVILRARLRGMLVNRSEDADTAHTCARLFRESPTPLTV